VELCILTRIWTIEREQEGWIFQKFKGLARHGGTCISFQHLEDGGEREDQEFEASLGYTKTKQNLHVVVHTQRDRGSRIATNSRPVWFIQQVLNQLVRNTEWDPASKNKNNKKKINKKIKINVKERTSWMLHTFSSSTQEAEAGGSSKFKARHVYIVNVRPARAT